jgi:Cu(I)/Ag(I) efflux system membrane fusion protein
MEPDPSQDRGIKGRPNWARHFHTIGKPIYLVVFLSLLAGLLLGTWYGSRKAGQAGTAGGRRILHYVDPMNPAHTSPEPGLAPCGMKMEPVYADGEGQTPPPANLPPGAVQVSPQKQQLIGVRLGVAEKAPYTHTLRALGRVVIDETRIYRLNAFVDGWILKTFDGGTGSLVMKNESLASYYSRDFITAEQAYFYALNTLERMKSSGESYGNQLIGVSSQIRGAEENLENLGMSKSQIKELARDRRLTQDIFLRAPVTSFILERKVSPGQKITRNYELYRLADLSHVWIVADLYENEGQFVRAGLKVQGKLPNQNLQIAATVSDILPTIDPVTRTLKVRLEADNPYYVLRPDMFLDVEFPVSLPATVHIPGDAVLDSGLKKIVFVDRGNGYFEPRKVETGWRLGDRVEIVKGLKPGERIVISGNFLIDSESRMKLAAAGMFGEVAKDVVCGINVDENKARVAGCHQEYQGQAYYFCSDACQKKFAQAPERYANKLTGPQTADAGGAAAKVPTLPATTIDPVSGLAVDPGYAQAMGLTREYQGQTYYFRYAASLEKFARDPEDILRKAATKPAPAATVAHHGDPVAAQKTGTVKAKEHPQVHPGNQKSQHYLVKALGLDGHVKLPDPLKETPVTDKDPVCGMKLGEQVVGSLAYKTPYKGKLYYFCSDECKQAFDRDPEVFVSKLATGPAPPAPGGKTPKPAAPVSTPTPMAETGKGKTPDPSGGHSHGVLPAADVPKEKEKGLKDLVCGMKLGLGTLHSLTHKTAYQGKAYYFCSEQCQQKFAQDPKAYTDKSMGTAQSPPTQVAPLIPGRDGKFRRYYRPERKERAAHKPPRMNADAPRHD